MKKLLPLALLLAAACGKELVCPAGETNCGGRCVSLTNDPANCGACGAAVGALGACVSGAAVCASDATLCGTACTDFARDPSHCGACNNACPASQLCKTGACTATCDGGYTACGRSCVDLLADHYNCGACGHACPGGQVCAAGACRPDVVVACYATRKVVPLTANLTPAGSSYSTPAGPSSIAVHGGVIYAANGWPQASVSVLPFDYALPTHDTTITGSDDLQQVGVVGDVVVVANAKVGTLLFLSLSGTVLGELAMPNQQNFPNPYSFAVDGTIAWVALTGGDAAGSGQAIAKVDVSKLANCAANPAGVGCGTTCGTSVLKSIDLTAVTGAADTSGRPYPSNVLATGGKIYVTLANLKQATLSCGTACSYTAWAQPAGHGKLAVVDPAAGDAVSIVDLGAGCGNAGAMALNGTTLWVACGSSTFPVDWPGVAVPVNLAVSPAAPGTALALSPVIPAALAFCGGKGYATDQVSRAVVRFDPGARTVGAAVNVCPDNSWEMVSSVACGH